MDFPIDPVPGKFILSETVAIELGKKAKECGYKFSDGNVLIREPSASHVMQVNGKKVKNGLMEGIEIPEDALPDFRDGSTFVNLKIQVLEFALQCGLTIEREIIARRGLQAISLTVSSNPKGPKLYIGGGPCLQTAWVEGWAYLIRLKKKFHPERTININTEDLRFYFTDTE